MARRITSRTVLAACIVALLGGVVLVRAHAWASRRPDTLRPLPPDLPKLPAAPPRLARPGEMVTAAYEFAGRHPEVLEYMPCYCGCEKRGHGSNHDCFVKSRDARGTVTWDDHAMVCGICIDIAWEARRMHGEGATVKEIRAFVEKNLASDHHGRTNTPAAPGS